MNTEPLVSVIIPTYNRPEYLRYALNSVISQTYKNIEIIVSDDAGNPDNYFVVSSFADSRIKYYRNESNLGIAANNISALTKTNGKYIADLNDDDFWEKDFLGILVPYLENNSDTVVAFSDHYIMNDQNEIDLEATESNSKLWKRDKLTKGIYMPFYDIAIVHRSIPIVMSALIRKSAINWDNFPLEVGCVYDLWINYLACCSGGAAYYYPERLTRYRVHSNSESSQGRLRVNKGMIFCYESFLQDNKLSSLVPELKKALAYAYRNAGSAKLKKKKTIEARRFFLQAIKMRVTIDSLFLLLLTLIPYSLSNKVYFIVFFMRKVKTRIYLTQ